MRVHIFTFMASTRFYLDTRRSKSDNPSVLKIVIAKRRESALIPLNVKVPPSQWDEKYSRIVKNNDAAVLNAYISDMKNKIDSIIADLTRSGEERAMSAQEIKQVCLRELNPERKAEEELKNSFLTRFIQYAEHTQRGTRKTFDYTLNRLTAYLGEEKLKQLRFEDITVDWLRGFDNFLKEESNSKNTRNIHYRNMRTVFNVAIDENVTTHYPFRRFKIKNEETAKRDLTVEELRLLFFYPCEEHAVHYLDIFKLSFYLHGVNCVDICNLTKEDYVKGRLQFHRTKTRHFYSKFVEPEAQQIIEKYRGKKYLINVMDHWSSDEYFRKKMNKVLQRIGPVKRSGLGGKKEYSPLFSTVTSYYARHTWASIASSIDIPNEVIAEGLGHEYGNRITNIYINFDIKKVDRANRKILDWVLYGKLNGEQVVAPGTPEFFGLTARQMKKLGMESAI
jgi:site-specific recombinase XerD